MFLLLTAGISNATPLFGTYTIPGSYTSIAQAFTDLNTNGVGGPCIFLINANYTETALSLTLTVPTANASSPITFKKDPAQSGANPKIIVSAGSVAVTDGGIIIAGTDYVTFEKVDIDASAQTTIEWGYALVKRQNVAPMDGCQHCTINSCNITMNKANTKAVGIYTGNHIPTATSSLTITQTTDACNDCSFDNNVITNVYIGISLNGYGAAAPYTLYDHNNTIGVNGGNTITNFGGSGVATYGIYATSQDLLKIQNNTINGGAGSTNRLAGIMIQTGTSSSGEFSNNSVTVASSATTSQNTYGIWNFGYGSTAATNAVSFHDNTISGATLVSGTGPLYGILNSATPDTLKIYNNTFSNFSNVTSGEVSILRTEASVNNVYIYNNMINNITSTGAGTMSLIRCQSAANAFIYGNNVYTCTSAGGTVNGIYTALGTNVTIYKNRLFDISSNGSAAAASMVYGINNTSTPNITVYNNFIYDLKANQATNNPSVSGLYLTGGNFNNIYDNTIFLNASSTGSTFGTAAAYIGSTPTTILRNNIFVNVSTPGATGYTVAYKRSSATLTSYSTTSNNNDFYAGTPGPNNLIFYDGTNAYQTLATYQAAVTPADAVSFTENPPFVNVTTAPYNVHIQSGVTTLCESGGTVVTTPAITTDYDDQPRFPNAGYPDNIYHPATAPDVGADEFAGGPLTPSLTFNVDMSTAQGFVPGSDLVYIAGNFPGATWNEPGTNPNLQLARVGTSLVYTLTLSLPAGTYNYKYFKNAGWNGGEYQGGSDRSVTINTTMTVNDQWGGTINWANLQWPGSGAINIGWDYNVYAQAYIANGITSPPGGAYGLQAWIGISTTNTNPNTWTNWIPAPFSSQTWDNDEFMLNIGPLITSPGTYYYASRFQFGTLPYVYGGYNGGFWDGTSNISGVLTVSLPAPAAFNVTGSGAYCQGTGGLPVGLSGSESGATYQLYKDAVALGTPMPGTGSALSFGNQLAGTYTVTGTNGGGTTPMNGSAVITESAPLPVSITIAASVNPVPFGSTVTMTATPVNGGTTPSYQWKVNGVKTGPDNAVYTFTPANNDVVSCMLVSSETCTTGNGAVSNEITLTVIPDVNNIQNITIGSGESVCYSATQTINVAGNGTTFTIQPGGSATMVAGQKISYLPGTNVLSGAYMHGYITSNNQYCSTTKGSIVSTDAQEQETTFAPADSRFRIYPNPTTGVFTLDLGNASGTEKSLVEIYGMRGDKVFSTEITGAGKHELTLAGKPTGVYMIRVISGNNTETARIIKQ